MTRRLVDLHARHQMTADADRKSNALRDLVGAAVAREEYLAAIIDAQPGEVIRSALSTRVRAALPPEVQRHVEEDVTVEGELDVLHEDNAAGGRYHHWLKSRGLRLSLHFAATAPVLQSGDRVRLRGLRVLQALVLGDSADQLTVLSAAALPNTFGAQKTAVFIVNFDNQPTVTSVSPSQAQGIVFTNANSVSNFFREASYQQTWLTGDVFGPYVVPASLGSTCNYWSIAGAAETAATAAGVNLSTYTRRVFTFPESPCAWWGVGTVGGNPSRTWVHGVGSSSIGTVTHEMGHNLGLYHSHALECGSATIGPNCTNIEYGDPFDVMGGTIAVHFNAAQKDQLGWLGYGASPPITTVTSSGEYTIDPYESPGSNPKALKVRTPSGDWYYVEYRQPIGFDAPYVQANANVRDGVVLHLMDNGNPAAIYLLDLTPETSSWRDPALGMNQTFVDPGAGLSISLAWANSTGAGVNMTLGTSSCVRRNPTVAVSPAQQQSAPGTALAYTVSVKNNDTGCSASSFSQWANVPSGWTATFAPSTLAIAAGGTLSTSLSVTSSTSAATGLYPITPTTANSALTTYTASTTAMYSVVSSGGGTSGTFSDDFERPDSTVLANGWLEVGGNLMIQGGQLRNAATKTLHRAVVPSIVGPAQRVSAKFASVDPSGSRFGLIARYQDPDNYYLCYRQAGGASRLRISRVVNGVETVLRTVSVSNPGRGAFFTLACVAQGPTLTLEFNGVGRLTATDSTFPTGSVGVVLGRPAGSGTVSSDRADAFRATAQ